MTVAEYIAERLHAHRVRRVYALSGGTITRLLDAIHRAGKIEIVAVSHEQIAGFAAEGEARITGVPGVALATSGPGATNLLTPLASCYFDSVPAVFITGQVNRSELRGAAPIRQLGFQETDVRAMAKPVTKAAWQIGSRANAPYLLSAAFDLARSGRPGPVLLDLPMDVQAEESIGEDSARATHQTAPPDVRPVLTAVALAQRPLVLVGGGVRAAGAAPLLRHALEAIWAPVVCSLQGLDVIPQTHPLHVGMIGTYGNRWANRALAECDVLLVLGSRLDVRQTGADVAGFAAGKQIVQVDVDAGEIGTRVPVGQHLVCDLRTFAQAVLDVIPHPVNGLDLDLLRWRAQIAEWRAAWPAVSEYDAFPGSNPIEIMDALGRAFEDSVGAYVLDVGAHQMWAAQGLHAYGARILSAGGLGAMGFAIPAAIGACLATGRQTVVVTGDGSTQVNTPALYEIARRRLPVKILVLNNQGHGMVRGFQRQYFDGRFVATAESAPDFVEVARAYGMPAERATRVTPWFVATPGPALLEIAIDPAVDVRPKMVFGRGLAAMDPPRT